MTQPQSVRVAKEVVLADHRLASCLANGLGTVRNITKAVKHYERAAALGYSPSMHALALLFENGNGVNVDVPRAVQLHHRAANLGYAPSKTALARFFRWGTCVPKDVARCISYLKEAIRDGCLEAIVAYGDCLRDGVGTAKNHMGAVNQYKVASEKGCALGHMRLSECFRDGVGVEKDIDTAFSGFGRAAREGELTAYFELARCYIKGIGTPVDLALGFKWMKKSADDSLNVRAMLTVSRFYASGTVVEKDWGWVVKYLHAAADRGYDKAKVELADCYLNGKGVPRDPKRAAVLYRQAEDIGNVDGMMGLAECYFDGIGVEVRDAEKAWYLLRRAMQAGSGRAHLIAGFRHLHGNGTDRDSGHAVQAFANAAKHGSVDGMYWLGMCYYNGWGTIVDKQNALSAFANAADSSCIKATLMVAYMVRNGIGTPANIQRAFALYEKAATTGNNQARICLAVCYMRGDGCRRNDAEARNILYSLSEEGNPLATRLLARFYYLGKGIPQNLGKAAELYSRASELGDIEATCWLGTCYRLGHGVTRDFDRAFELYDKASGRGSVVAAVNVALCYATGIGVEINLEASVDRYEKVVESGGVYAVKNLLKSYERVGNNEVLAKREARYLHALQRRTRMDPGITARLAMLYFRGRGMQIDQKKAIQLLSEAVKTGKATHALRCLAYCHLNGHISDSREEEAKKLLEKAIKQGSKKAKLTLGKCLIEGICGRIAPEDGMKLIREAADSGVGDAIILLGDHSYRGYIRFGVLKTCQKEVDYFAAVQYYKRAGGRSDALFRLARCYMAGQGVLRCPRTALKLMQRSAGLGYPYAQLALASMYEVGSPCVELNLHKAMQLYECGVHRVTKRSRERAMYKFSIFLLKHGLDVRRFTTQAELEERVRQLLEIARGGKACAAGNDLAVLLERRVQEEEDEDTESTSRAFQIFVECCEAVPRSLSNAGICLESGIGTCRDLGQAKRYYERAVRRGDGVALSNLAVCLMEEKEFGRAVELLQEAEKREDVNALVNLGYLYERGEGLEKDSERAFTLYFRAMEAGSAAGCLNLAGCYEKEVGTGYDARLAEKYYRMADELGSVEARDRLKIYER